MLIIVGESKSLNRDLLECSGYLLDCEGEMLKTKNSLYYVYPFTEERVQVFKNVEKTIVQEILERSRYY